MHLPTLEDICNNNIASQVMELPEMIRDQVISETGKRLVAINTNTAARKHEQTCIAFITITPVILGNMLDSMTKQGVPRHDYVEMYKDKCDEHVIHDIIMLCDDMCSQLYNRHVDLVVR